MSRFLKITGILALLLTAATPGFVIGQDAAPSETGNAVTVSMATNGVSGLRATSGNTANSLPLVMPGFSVWRSIGAMLVVIGGLLAVNAWFTKRRTGLFANRDRNKRIVVLERTAIDHRRSLVLVEADGQRILLGLAPDRMETVAVLSGKADERVPDVEVSGKSNPSFSESLENMLEIGRAHV